jgi:predicted membrane channel-forming protein YqfA (hemolysin III family)
MLVIILFGTAFIAPLVIAIYSGVLNDLESAILPMIFWISMILTLFMVSVCVHICQHGITLILCCPCFDHYATILETEPVENEIPLSEV